MRRMTRVVIAASFVAAGIGILVMLTYVAAGPKRDSTDKPAIATVSPFEIMKERGKELPPAKNADPF
jgi:hypothetical protein